MRCDCCNKRLTNSESVITHKTLHHYLNTCLACLNGLNIPYKGLTIDFDDDDGYNDLEHDTEFLDQQSSHIPQDED